MYKHVTTNVTSIILRILFSIIIILRYSMLIRIWLEYFYCVIINIFCSNTLILSNIFCHIKAICQRVCVRQWVYESRRQQLDVKLSVCFWQETTKRRATHQDFVCHSASFSGSKLRKHRLIQWIKMDERLCPQNRLLRLPFRADNLRLI